MEGTVGGRCLCGAVVFEIGLPTLFCAHCHCTLCQRAHGAGFVTWAGVPEERFRLVSGQEVLQRYHSSDHGFRSFCTTCGSTLLCQSTRHPGRVDVVIANLDGPLDRKPQLHAYTDTRADWIEVGDGLPRLREDGTPEH